MLNISFALLGKKILPSVQRKSVEQTKGVGELCLCVHTLTDFVLSADQGIVMFIYGWKKLSKIIFVTCRNYIQLNLRLHK